MKALFGLLLPLLLAPVFAPAANAKPIHILVSVGELVPAPNLVLWQKEACSLIHQIGNHTVTAGVQVSCRQDSIHVIDTYLQQLKADNDYHIRLLRGFNGSYRLTVSNWSRSLESDFGSLGWNIGIEPHARSLREEALKNVLTNFFSYLEKEESLKTQWLLMARYHSKAITFDFGQLRFKTRLGGKPLSVESAARLFEKENIQNAEYLRSQQELALAFTTMSLAELDIFKPDFSLLALLEKTARAGQMATRSWSRVIKFDERGASGLTLELIGKVSSEVLVAPGTANASEMKMPPSKKPQIYAPLIFLF